jgi:hypothetical protein
MKRIENYLTRLAQGRWPGAMVFEDQDPKSKGKVTRWTLERDGMETIALGEDFGKARQGLYFLLKGDPAKQETPGVKAS